MGWIKQSTAYLVNFDRYSLVQASLIDRHEQGDVHVERILKKEVI